MASSISRKPCSKCYKSIGVLTCDGCEQSFCTKHIQDHRQELSIEVDNIGQECDLLRRSLIREDNDLLPLIDQINLWEEDSIEKIRQIAQQTRTELQEYFTEKKNQVDMSLNKLIEEFQISQQSGDYTEIDLKLWTEQLNELRKTFEKMPIVETIEQSTIPTIKIQNKTNLYFSRLTTKNTDEKLINSNQSSDTPTEIFDRLIDESKYSKNSLLATHSGYSQGSTIVYITELYTTGIHQIHFRIEEKTNKYLFFGIINSLEQLKPTVFNSSSVYGWMAPDVRVIKSRKQLSAINNKLFQSGDEINLTVNCTSQQILLEHPASDTIDRISIDLRICPLPWKVILAFFDRNDSVRILY